MLVTFKSGAAADVIMFGETATKLIAICGKDPDDKRGILTVEQLPEAIRQLEAAIDEDKARQAEQTLQTEQQLEEQGRTGMAAPVGLAQRAWPLLQMLRDSEKESKPVTWGV